MSKSKTPPLVDNRPIIPLIDTLTSLQQWAIDSMQYVKRRNHLDADEKDGFYTRFEQYEYYLRKLIKKYREGELVLMPESIPGEIEKHLHRHGNFNQYASHYELPRYPLPDSTPPAKAFDFIYFQTLNDSLASITWAGDDLMCQPAYAVADVKPDDLLVVMYRANYRQPRRVKLGLFRRLEGNSLVLKYESPELVQSTPDWQVSMYDVVHLFKVITISRNRKQEGGPGHE